MGDDTRIRVHPSMDEQDCTLKPTAPTQSPSQLSPWNPRYWSWKKWIAAVTAVCIVVAAAVVPVKVVEMNRYPVYSPLSYSLQDVYSGVNFFDAWDFGNGTEATNGFTNYVTREGAAWSNLTYATPNQAIIKVLAQDDTGPAGRPTVKLLSKQRYTQGLFLFDIEHVPFGCGTWPAIWTSDPDPEIWPSNGEIDIVEAVNQGTKGTQMTLHTTDGCQMRGVKRKQTGKVLSTNCLNSTNYNMGCAVAGRANSYGDAANRGGGGVYAMEWRTAGIRMWFFPRSAIPPDVRTALTNDNKNTAAKDGGKPDPSSWGMATADFPSTGCDIDKHFKNHRIIINISLCGDWAGAQSIYTDEYACPGTCAEYVGSHPEGFAQAYWAINSIRVYSGQQIS
ncbi:hypothetical protein Dda_7968 [Drechslerella dactyloides]|uniref:GH16 domain-containing protein n=1 Tax=Drechslerella dactyloides TaxID=74499 RepID=A0AAD6IRG5_DREDA|nr:hypothetical protein Dda_7968 [Drechslerella dactyloides]